MCALGACYGVTVFLTSLGPGPVHLHTSCTGTSPAPGPVHHIYPSHRLLQDLYTTCTPSIPCFRTCTPHLPLTSLAPGPVRPRYPSHPLFQDLSTAGTHHIPCSRTCTRSEPLLPGPIHSIYYYHIPLHPFSQGAYTPRPNVTLKPLAPWPVHPMYHTPK